jgi:dUTP pyrophosphatase
MEECEVKIKKIDSKAEIPSYLYDTDVGFDIKANEEVDLLPGEQKNVSTGLIFEIPKGYVGLIRDRAGIVTKMGIQTCAGTFDPGFRGEVSIVLINNAEETVCIEKGMRIAQMLIIPVVKPKIVLVKTLNDTKRGKKGFGSTGFKSVKIQKRKNSK